MFSSPAVQIYSSENAENRVQRKQVPNQLSRKPFIDRSVNGKSSTEKPMKSKNSSDKDNIFKQKLSPKPPIPQISPEDDLNGEDFMFSGKDMDDYNDIWPPLCLGKESILKILRNQSFPKNSPPPSVNSDYEHLKTEPFIDPDFLELFPNEINSIEVPVLLDESFEVGLPEIEPFEDFDTSY